MKINVQATNFNVDQKLVDFTQRKIDKLYKFYDKILKVDVFFKVENTPARVNKFAEIKIGIVGESIVVKKLCKSFEESIDLSVKAAERMLIRHKELLRS
ncbi:MAG: ribosome-associated translation inhibitor RaiA [Flavobacteriaceae bacterium]|nr:ribosome-associated translation inhibitor RaiA [Flavobacteriaceae bacterium]